MTSYLVPFQSYRSLLFKFWTLRFRATIFLGRGLKTTYDVHLGLIGKRVVDFLLVLISGRRSRPLPTILILRKLG